jgi:hypothetical protein
MVYGPQPGRGGPLPENTAYPEAYPGKVEGVEGNPEEVPWEQDVMEDPWAQTGDGGGWFGGGSGGSGGGGDWGDWS